MPERRLQLWRCCGWLLCPAAREHPPQRPAAVWAVRYRATRTPPTPYCAPAPATTPKPFTLASPCPRYLLLHEELSAVHHASYVLRSCASERVPGEGDGSASRLPYACAVCNNLHTPRARAPAAPAPLTSSSSSTCMHQPAGTHSAAPGSITHTRAPGHCSVAEGQRGGGEGGAAHACTHAQTEDAVRSSGSKQGAKRLCLFSWARVGKPHVRTHDIHHIIDASVPWRRRVQEARSQRRGRGTYGYPYGSQIGHLPPSVHAACRVGQRLSSVPLERRSPASARA